LVIEMLIMNSLDRHPLHVQLYNKIKNQILSGKLPAQTKLSSVRLLSLELSVSRNTVEYVYEQLCTEGFIYSKPRSGYYVSALDPEFVLTPSKKTLPLSGNVTEEMEQYAFDFHPAGISPTSFPINIWRKLISESLLANPEQFSLYGNTQGEFALRLEIQRYLERFRGVACNSEQIVIGCGLQENLSIIAQVLKANHSVVAVEDPGHWLPRSIFQNLSYVLNPIPVNPDGINLGELQHSNSTIVYVTPSHQFPLGYVMPVENRLKLINWAESAGGVIIEDDYDSELRYHGKPIPALQGLRPEGNIIYIGTFSKVLSPALRISYIVLPYCLLGTYKEIFHNYATTVPLLDQNTLCKFMAQGYWDRHLRKMRTIYKKKHDALIQSIARHFGDRANILGQGAGLHVVLDLVDNHLKEYELMARAKEKGIRLFPISGTYQSNNDEHRFQVMLGFGKMTQEEADAGIDLLHQAWYQR
jgi:GntR family transcriptional regulator / MocR family aminotransferase